MIQKLFNGKVMLGALGFALFLLVGSGIYLFFLRPAPSATGGPATAAVSIIPAPTGTPRSLPPTLTSIPPTQTQPATPAPGEFAIGNYVQITNTGAEGLNIRKEPGLASDVIFSGFDSEAFLITGGPRNADGYTWWLLIASYDATRTGWAAQNFLSVIPSP